MTKLMVIPQHKDLDIYEKHCDAFLLAMTGLSINFPVSFSIEDIKKIKKIYPNKDLFVSVNKNMRNQDLEILKETLRQIDELSIHGIFYYDVSVVEFKQELELQVPLVWHQEHLTTNYGTCNYWYDFGATYTCLSNEITFDEIKEISKQAKARLMIPVFGHIPMFTSARHVVKNYGAYFSLAIGEGVHYLKKEGYTYPIIDEEAGTTVYSSFILNALEETVELKKMGFSYGILNSFGIEDEVFQKVVQIFNAVNEQNLREMSKQLEQLALPLDKGFLYKETIYKVK